jgi:hypothetical protein
VREAPFDLTERVRRLARQTRQLAILRSEDALAGAHVERFERILDAEHVGAHARQAVAAARLRRDPVVHLRVDELLPPDVYRALVDAIPAPVFFEGDEARQELRVPPRLAPTHTVVAWAFFTEVMLDAVSGALVAAFDEPLAAMAQTRFPELPPIGKWGEITLTQGRLVRRTAGEEPPDVAERPWDLLTGVLDLARPGNDDANTLVVCLGQARTDRYAQTIDIAPPGTERYTYEFGIGPTREARRRLTEPRKLSTYTE